MERVCENCKYKSTKENKCLYSNDEIPTENICFMWKADLKKLIEEIQEENCGNGACKIQ